MDRNKDNIPVSALYTAATWRWGGLPCAELVTPRESRSIFNVVNGYMAFYRLINPRKFSLRHQLLHRHTAIDHLLAQSGCSAVVELACGFSPRGSQMSRDPALHYTEMDLPDVIEAKRRQLASSEEGRRVLARENFHLRAADITTLDFAAALPMRRTAIVTEGLMMYFDRDLQMAIWRRMARFLAQAGGVYLFDYIPLSDEPPRSLLGEGFHLLRERVFGIRSDFAYDQRSRTDVIADLEAAGFGQVEAFDTGEVAQRWSLPESTVPSRTIVYCCRGNEPTHGVSTHSGAAKEHVQ